jgi:hypothetical protein
LAVDGVLMFAQTLLHLFWAKAIIGVALGGNAGKAQKLHDS